MTPPPPHPALDPEPPVDVHRDVVALFGLVFDVCSLDQACATLEAAAQAGRRCVLVTPNVNFAVTARDDPAFRDSVWRSELSVADGMPIVWAARLAGLPIRERVAGSDLFARLQARGSALRVYFFGGPPGVAGQAAAALNRAAEARGDGRGLRAVGHQSPGFGSVADMGGPAVIDAIHASAADFLVVALGARKGQAWIEQHRGTLRTPLISHLGAVVNFVAGTVARAPVRWQRLGLEWLWRIRQEPGLWRRYAGDALGLAGLMLGQGLPLAWAARFGPQDRTPPTLVSEPAGPGLRRLRLAGAWRRADLAPLRAALAEGLREGGTVAVDLSAVTQVDPATVGLLSLVARHRSPPRLQWTGPVPPRVARCFRHCGLPF